MEREIVLGNCGLSNAHAELLTRAGDVTLCLRLPLTSFIVYANREGSGDAASPDPSLFAYVISTFFTCVSSNINRHS